MIPVYSKDEDTEAKQEARPDLGLSDEQTTALLKEIRDYREYSEGKWKKIREESQRDRRFLNGDPWEPEDREAREVQGIPCINHDELNQYTNQAVNGVRANKRGIKVDPAGAGSSDQTAELRQGLIRGIEYKSKGQQAYINAFQHLVESRYGFFRISHQYVDNSVDGKDDQEIVIKPILNQDSVLYDPDCTEADWSDARKVLVLAKWQKSDFRARWPWAKVQDYGYGDSRIAAHWIREDTVVVAEYWKVKIKRVRKRSGTRMVEQKTPCKYLTNGIDILEIEELVADGTPMGEHIPIIPMFGPQRYVDYGSGPELTMGSLVGLAREPQLSLAFLCSQQLEEAGRAPKIPVTGYEGQFDTTTDWKNLHKIRTAYAEVKASTPESQAVSPNALLPLPQFQQFTPNTQAYEVAKDSCRRAIQAAIGSSPLPTAAQRQNEKSGKALEQIWSQQQIGSYHFNDIFENALEFAGRVIDSWIPFVYDTAREVALGLMDDSTQVASLTPEMLQEGDHSITISTGPSTESQREAASEFLDTLVGNMAQIPPPGTPQAKLLALTIRMKQLGPKGDEMADILDPQQAAEIPPQAQQAIAEGQQKAAVMEQALQQAHLEIQKLEQEKAGKVVDNEYRMKLEQMKIEAQVATAEITTKAQKDSERIAVLEDLLHKIMDQGHAASLQASEQAHAHEMADQQAEVAQDQQAADQSHQMTMAEQQAKQQKDSQ